MLNMFDPDDVFGADKGGRNNYDSSERPSSDDKEGSDEQPILSLATSTDPPEQMRTRRPFFSPAQDPHKSSLEGRGEFGGRGDDDDSAFRRL